MYRMWLQEKVASRIFCPLLINGSEFLYKQNFYTFIRSLWPTFLYAKYNVTSATAKLQSYNMTTVSQGIIFSIHCECLLFYPRFQHKPSVLLETQKSPDLFQSITTRADWWCQLSSNCPKSVATRQILSSLFFWKLTSLMSHDIISSNLVLIVLLNIGFQCKYFWMRENR